MIISCFATNKTSKDGQFITELEVFPADKCVWGYFIIIILPTAC